MKKLIKIAAASIAGLSFASTLTASEFSFDDSVDMYELTLNFEKIKKEEGSICYSIFPDNGTFPSEEGETIAAGCVDTLKVIENGITIELPAGEYASAVYHDVNGNGEMDMRNILGVKAPKEPFGFSNNPKIKMSAPSFEDCSFDVSENTEISIELKKLF